MAHSQTGRVLSVLSLAGVVLLLSVIFVKATNQLEDQSATDTEATSSEAAAESQDSADEAASVVLGVSNTDTSMNQSNIDVEGEVAPSVVPMPSAAAVKSTASASIGRQRPELLSWNVFSATEVAPGQVLSDIRAKQVRFLNENNQFELINTALQASTDGWCVTKAPFTSCFPRQSTGTATFDNNSRFDPQTKRRITAPVLRQELSTIGVADVAGIPVRRNFGFGDTAAVFYENAYPNMNADFAYLVHDGDMPRLRQVIQFNDRASLPTQDFELRAETAYSEPVDIFEGIGDRRVEDVATITTDQGIVAKRKSGERAVAYEPFYIWDSSQPVRKRMRIQTRLEPLAEDRYAIVKIVPRAFFDDAVFPVYTDETVSPFYSTSSDCHARRVVAGGTSWSGVRDGAETAEDTSASADTAVHIRWGDGPSDQWAEPVNNNETAWS